MKVVIIGGVAGGASAAARLRRLDEFAEIVIYERGEYISFASCGLPYYIGGEIKSKGALTLQTPEGFKSRFNVKVKTNSEVIAIDREAKTVTVSSGGVEYLDNYDKLILSMGAAPIVPAIPGASNSRVFTLRNIPDTYRIKDYITANKPRHAVIVGGGYIGIEMAESLVANGVAVTIVEMTNQLIEPLDYDMACDVHNYLEEKGVQLKLSAALESITDNAACKSSSNADSYSALTVKLKAAIDSIADNAIDRHTDRSNTDNYLTLRLSSGDSINADIVIMAVGVKPDTAIARSAGIELNTRGGIVVSKYMLTSDSNIYAVGDAVEVLDYVTGQAAMIPLAGPANKQGRIAADNICGGESIYRGTQGSAILKVFDMAVATTGINEKTAIKSGIAYEKSYTFSSSHAGYYPGATNMSMKIIYAPSSGRLLGAQVVGYDGVDKRCDIIATCIRAKLTAHDLMELELCYAPPFGSAKDPVNMAGYVIDNIITGKVKTFHWHEVVELRGRKDIIMLDTRTTAEYARGKIDGFINMPLDGLRANLDKLDISKAIYVHCQSGLRSYIACRILSQHGYNCYNLSGGYRLYNSIFR